MAVFARTMLALGAALLLSSCLVTPGRFTSALDVRADRSFTFAYKGEIIALNLDKAMQDGMVPTDEAEPESKNSSYRTIAATQEGDTGATGGASDKDSAARMQAIAAALMKEKGFRSVRYIDKGRFEIDYAISGTLDHAFVFPFNIDANIVFPFVAIELRGDDRVRVKAPGFANDSNRMAGPMGASPASDEAARALDGTFTLTTNAEIVSQNQENGPATVPNGRSISWKVNALTTEAPMAVLRFPAH